MVKMGILNITGFDLVSVVSVGCSDLSVIPWVPPGFSVHGIFQARILQWVAIS